MASKMKGDKKQHIQVFTRVRPMSSQEVRSSVVVDCPSSKEVSVRDKAQTKTFTFDKVFGPDSKQVDVYKTVVSPLIREVLQGYNCTVFAYGQTGTGKTYTMVGDKMKDDGKGWEDDPCCGIIPRTLSHLFDELKVRAEEFTVRVSFLELYNEELCDLLAPNENLRLYEDSMKKGSVIVSGLEERTVHNKDDVYSILDTGNLRRQTAQTLMNAQSSRSHTIFTITVHIKVTTPEGEDLIKTGKLNLVDLAGSENIGRSGAVDMRAREAGNINQSLLTLGRVITSLVERAPHVPYRESKLTRILQDSLGGRTKTSIIATISPALCNLEETLSTLDYAHRARNITNKPEINQKTSKRALIKEYTDEIDRLRRDLIAARDKHGVYLASENYNSMVSEIENLNKELVSKIQILKVREDEMAKQEDIMISLNMHLSTAQCTLERTTVQLQEKERICSEKEKELEELTGQAQILLKTADEAINDTQRLHDRLERSRMIHEHNQSLHAQFKGNLRSNLTEMKQWVKELQRRGVGWTTTELEAGKNLSERWTLFFNETQNMATQYRSSTTDVMNSCLDLSNRQTEVSQAFLNTLLEHTNTVKELQNDGRERLLMALQLRLVDMTEEFSKLHDKLMENVHTLTEQGLKLQMVQQREAQLLETIRALPQVLESRMEARERNLNHLTAQEATLRKERDAMRAANLEFCQQLQSMTDAFAYRVRRDVELDTEHDCMATEDRLAETALVEELRAKVQAAVAETEERVNTLGQLTCDASKTSLAVCGDMRDSMIPMVQALTEQEEKHNSNMQQTLAECMADLDSAHDSLQTERSVHTERLEEHARAVRGTAGTALAALGDFERSLTEQLDKQRVDLEETSSQSTTRLQTAASDISEHCEKLFSGIHQQSKKIDFFEEKTKHDEKTGQTPQRKDFVYPKRLVSSEDIKTKASNGFEASWTPDLLDPSDDKENISIPRKPLRGNNSNIDEEVK